MNKVKVLFIRVGRKIYDANDDGTRGDADQIFQSIGEAKRWVRRQEQAQPGSVRVENPEPIAPDHERSREIAELIRAQRRDLAPAPSTWSLPQPYVMPDTTSYSRQRQARRDATQPYVMPDTTSYSRQRQARRDATQPKRNSARVGRT